MNTKALFFTLVALIIIIVGFGTYFYIDSKSAVSPVTIEKVTPVEEQPMEKSNQDIGKETEQKVITTVPVPTATPIVKDCGVDIDCFIKESETCSPAKVVYTSTQETFGVKATVTSFMQMTPINNQCNVYNKFITGSLKYSPESGLSAEDEALANKLYDEQFSGKDGNCLFGVVEYSNLLKKHKMGSFDSRDYERCTGPLYDSTTSR